MSRANPLYPRHRLCTRLRPAQNGGHRAMTQAAANHGFGCACHPSMTYTPVSRRRFLAGAGAIGAVSVLQVRGARAQASKAKVIDTHHHYYPPAYQKAWIDWEDTRKIPHITTHVG